MTFYAKFKGNDKEFFLFPTEEARDKWVNFQDDLSIADGITADNATSQREAIDSFMAIYYLMFEDTQLTSFGEIKGSSAFPE